MAESGLCRLHAKLQKSLAQPGGAGGPAGRLRVRGAGRGCQPPGLGLHRKGTGPGSQAARRFEALGCPRPIPPNPESTKGSQPLL